MTTTTSSTTSGTMTVADLKLEAVVIPVADVDRSKAFYAGLGWRLDADFAFDNGFRVVQFTPPGSPASVQFGAGITTAEPGSAQGLYLVVSDIQAARDRARRAGASTISEVFHPVRPGAQFVPGAGSGRVSGRAEDGASYGSFATFADPDGNTWLLQEVTTRLPGRIDTARDVVRLGAGPRAGAGPRGDRPRRARGPQRRRVRPAVAGLVRGVHGRRAIRRRAAPVVTRLTKPNTQQSRRTSRTE